jgi:hypothetical protein
MRVEGRTNVNVKVRVPTILLATVGLASAVVCADLKKGYYSPAELGSLRQAAPPELSPDSNHQASDYPVPAVDLTAGDGLQEVQVYCNTCHSPRYITMQPPLPAATWGAEVNKMNKVFGAGIPEESTQKIILYLQAHYTEAGRRQSGK